MIEGMKEGKISVKVGCSIVVEAYTKCAEWSAIGSHWFAIA